MEKSAIQEKFNFFIPLNLYKGKEGDNKENEIWIDGICSSATEDTDQEILEPLGFDFKALLTKGFFNWDHNAKKTSSAIIGEPTEAKVINNGQDFYIKGYLYGDLEEAQHVGRLAYVLNKASKTRRLGFSIEGQVIEKDFANPKRIRRARITGCAITPCPKNPNTLLNLIKGEYSEAYQEHETDITLKECPKCQKETIVDGKCIECGYVEKAMEVNINLNPESVEHDKKPKVGLELTKSDIYDQILSRYTNDSQQAKKIYNLIKSTNDNLFNMTTNISQEVINKAFSFLDAATMPIKKGGHKKEEEDEESEEEREKREAKEKEAEEDEHFDKAAEICTSMIKKGRGKEEMEEEMEKSGIPKDIAKAVCDACISEASREKDGGKMTKHSIGEGLEKSEAISLFEETQDLIKGLNDTLNGKFKSVGTILQSVAEQNIMLKGQNDELQKSITSLTSRLEQVENTPTPSKSLRNVQVVERFTKSEDNPNHTGKDVYSLSKAQDRRALCNILGELAIDARQKNTPNLTLEKAASELEITKSMSRDVLPLLRSRNIEIVE